MTQKEFQKEKEELKHKLDDVVEKHRQTMLITAWFGFAALLLYSVLAFCIGILPWIKIVYYLTH